VLGMARAERKRGRSARRTPAPIGFRPEMLYFHSRGAVLPLLRVQVRDGPALFVGFAVAWVYVVLAGLLEIAWAYAMKQSYGFTRLWPTVITISAMVGSVGLLTLAMRTIPLSTAYPIWTGIGAVGAFVVGVTILGEQATAARIIAATLIVVGLVMMKVSSSS
jgi:quaternary ammonium compound-resistance protein SugE